MLDLIPVSKELYKKRIKICLECPKYNETYHQCEECGCFLIAKAFLTITTCPLDKWPKKEKLMSDLRNYWKSLNELKMLQLIFDDHFTELGYEKLNSTTFDLTNNIIVQFQPNSTDPSIIIADNSTNIITSYLFDPSIVFKESVVIKSQRQKDTYVFDDIIEDLNIYSLLKLVTQQKEIYLID